MDKFLDETIKEINNFLKSEGQLDFFEQNDELYIGGSLPAYFLSKVLRKYNYFKMTNYYNRELEESRSEEDAKPIKKTSLKKSEIPRLTETKDTSKIKNIYNLEINDIDIYTTNSMKTLNTLHKTFEIKNREGVNLMVLPHDDSDRTKKMQFILAEVDNFYDEVLSSYDTEMIKVGYHPATQRLIVHNDFIRACIKNRFTIVNERTTKKRKEKIMDRIYGWFGYDFEIIEISKPFYHFSEYYYSSASINIYKIGLPPKYLQLFIRKYKCLVTGKIQNKLISNEGDKILNDNFTNIRSGKTISITGGYRGLGGIIYKTLKYNGYKPFRTTSRSFDEKVNFKLGKTPSQYVINKLLDSDVMILNAYSTLDGNELIWNTKLKNFSEKLALEKINTNTFGYIKFLKTLINYRYEKLKKGDTHNIILVYMDASESKCEDKLQDGKHLELNIAKAATKQVFYTNASLLASLGIFTVCFDPGWLSYHGVSLEKKEAMSDKLIDPVTCSKGLMHYINSLNIENLIKEKKFIHDVSFYDLIKEYKQN